MLEVMHMNTIRKVGLKGEVTIPKKLREQFGIRPGTVVSFDSDSGSIFIFRQKAQSRSLTCSSLYAKHPAFARRRSESG